MARKIIAIVCSYMLVCTCGFAQDNQLDNPRLTGGSLELVSIALSNLKTSLMHCTNVDSFFQIHFKRIEDILCHAPKGTNAVLRNPRSTLDFYQQVVPMLSEYNWASNGFIHLGYAALQTVDRKSFEEMKLWYEAHKECITCDDVDKARLVAAPWMGNIPIEYWDAWSDCVDSLEQSFYGSKDKTIRSYCYTQPALVFGDDVFADKQYEKMSHKDSLYVQSFLLQRYYQNKYACCTDASKYFVDGLRKIKGLLGCFDRQPIPIGWNCETEEEYVFLTMLHACGCDLEKLNIEHDDTNNIWEASRNSLSKIKKWISCYSRYIAAEDINHYYLSKVYIPQEIPHLSEELALLFLTPPREIQEYLHSRDLDTLVSRICMTPE